MRTVQAGGIVTVAAMVTFWIVMWRRSAAGPARGGLAAAGVRRRKQTADYGNIPLFPQQASSFASHVDGLYFFIVGVTAFFAVLVVVLVTIFAIRFRRRHATQVGVPVHGALALEIIWTFIPLCLAMAMFYWGATVYFEMARPPQNAMEVYTVGKRWMWKFQHVTGQREINELHVPLNTPVKLIIGSEDVIHSVYVPAFRVKMDAVPGKTTTLWFNATKPGRYHLFCTEYCGQRHSAMIGWVEVMEPAAFQTWLAGGPAPRQHGRRRPEAVHRPRVRHLPPRRRPGTRAVAAGRLRRGSEAAGRGDRQGRRGVPARVDRQPAGEARGRFPAADAHLPGTDQRGAA